MSSGAHTVAGTWKTVQKSIGAFMVEPATLARAEELGLPRWQYYFGGRGGVLGDTDADVVTAAFGFFHPGFVRKMWERARAVMAPAEVAAEYARSCHEWGRSKLAGTEGLERFAELAERVAGAADPAGLPLFAGWRALPLPADPPARAAHLLFVLREHRGGVHLLATRAAGLTPLEAVIAAHGADGARFNGFREEPYPDPDAVGERYEQAQAVTDALDAVPYETLGEDEGTELVTLVGQVKATLTAG